MTIIDDMFKELKDQEAPGYDKSQLNKASDSIGANLAKGFRHIMESKINAEEMSLYIAKEDRETDKVLAEDIAERTVTKAKDVINKRTPEQERRTSDLERNAKELEHKHRLSLDNDLER